MKKILQSSLILLLVSFLSLFPVLDINATYQEAYEGACASKLILSYAGYSTPSGCYTERGTLDERESVIFRKTGYAGNRYAFVVAGCSYTRDIDIYVYDEYGDLIVSDSDADQSAVVEFYSRYTGTYYIKIRMYDSTSDDVHWAFTHGWL